MPPSLGKAITSGVLGVIVLIVVKYNQERFSPMWNGIMVAIAIGLLGYAITEAGNYILQTGASRFADFWNAYHSPSNRKLTTISRMNEAQLAAIHYTDLMVRMKVRPSGFVRVWETLPVELTDEDMRDMLAYCRGWDRWPQFPPVSLDGRGPNQERKKLQSFTWAMVHLGYAEAAKGNQPARWLLSVDTVESRLGL